MATSCILDTGEALRTPSSSPPGGASADDLSDSFCPPASGTISAENYLTLSEGCQGLLSIPELEECVQKCRDLVVESTECSDERRWLVRRLVELRLRLTAHTDAPAAGDGPPPTAVLLGHHFSLRYEPKSTMKKVCDRCCSTIWHLVQSWYQCQDCHYKCHVNCLSRTIRTCAHVILADRPEYENRICPEIGLSAQSYRCHECSTSISIALPKGPYSLANPFSLMSSVSEARRCDYTGYYYCTACHWNSTDIIPARVLKNWDFTPRPVCRASHQLLKLAKDRPLIKIEPRLYELIDDFAQIKRMRSEIAVMKHYIATCRLAEESELFCRILEWRQHLIHSPDVFSLKDLIDLQSGVLLSRVKEAYDSLRNHITAECRICFGRGHFCGFCKKYDVLFPFDVNAYVCPNCAGVQHKTCWIKCQTCHQCQRISTRNKSPNLEPDIDRLKFLKN